MKCSKAMHTLPNSSTMGYIHALLHRKYPRQFPVAETESREKRETEKKVKVPVRLKMSMHIFS